MSDDESERRLRAERLLLRSAHLDAPRPERRARVIERVLAAAEVGERPRRHRLALSVAFALSLAAGAVLLAKVQSGAKERSAQAETAPIAPAPASVPSASGSPRALSPCPKLVVAQGGAPLIDDLEDRNARLLIADGRGGSWMVYNDGTGKQVPPGMSPLHPVRLTKARGHSQYALHTTGEKFRVWGSSVVLTFTDSGGCYDVSAYRGLEFWAKGNTRIYVKLAVVDEVTAETGGFCSGQECYSGPNKPFDLAPEWQKYTLTFAELERLNEPRKVHFDAKRVVSLNLAIRREDTPFDVWLDDVRFLEAD